MNELDMARNIINETDKEIARLFEQRMDAVRMVANYKKEHGLPIEDSARENELIARNSEMVESDDYRSYYVDFLRSTIDISKKFQHRLLDGMRVAYSGVEGAFGRQKQLIPVKTSSGSYDIILERGALDKTGEYLNLARKVLIVTDSGVPKEYSNTVASNCKTPYVVTIEQGESSKNIKNFELLLSKLVEYQFTRSDCIVAVGGGVVGDLSGFVASAYMRGIDFYNIPTTLLSQVDSSIGGKTAIDFMGIKNVVGAFYPPKRVIIDPETLKTLPERHIANGLAESLKMALTHDEELFVIFEQGNINENIDLITERSLMIKNRLLSRMNAKAGCAECSTSVIHSRMRSKPKMK